MGNRLTPHLVGLGVVAVVLFLKSQWPSPSFTKSNPSTEVSGQDSRSAARGEKLLDAASPKRRLRENLRDQFAKASDVSKAGGSGAELRKAIRLKLDLPFELREMDLHDQEDVYLAWGEQKAWGSALAVAASPRIYTVEEALEFGKELLLDLPDRDKLKIVELAQAVPLKDPEKQGFKEAFLASGKLANGEEIHFVHLVRQDTKGTYLLISYGPGEHFEEAEEMYESEFSKLKALPAR